MSPADQLEPLFKRVVVVLDASFENLMALESLAVLPDVLVRRLDVVFVEEEDLMRVAGFPFACEISFAGTGIRVLDTKIIERDFRTVAEHARRVVKAVTQQRNLECRFEVVRSRIVQVVGEIALEENLIVIGARGDSPVRRNLARLASTTGLSLLIVNRRAAMRSGPIIIHTDESEVADRVRALAEGIARASGEPLFEMPDLSEFLITVGVSTAEPRPWVRGAYPMGFRPGLAILGRNSWPKPDSLDSIFEQATCPTLVVGRSVSD